MALSNMIKEPRREIIETVIGIIVVCPLIYGYYYLCTDIHAEKPEISWAEAMFLAVIVSTFLAAGLAIVIGLLMGIHKLGDIICARMEAVGIQARPRARYK